MFGLKKNNRRKWHAHITGVKYSVTSHPITEAHKTAQVRRFHLLELLKYTKSKNRKVS